MTRSILAIATLILIGLTGTSSSTEQSNDSWLTLLDGTTLDGWNTLGDATWELVDGAVQGDGEPGFLVTSDSYDNFQLTLSLIHI